MPMDPWHAALLEGLRGFEEAAASAGSDGGPARLRAAMGRLVELEQGQPPAVDPQLRHYLQRRSYEKARLWLEGVDPEAGPCPR